MSGHHEPVGERQGRQPAQDSRSAAWGRHKALMERMKLLPIFRCLYCGLPHPTRCCPEAEVNW